MIKIRIIALGKLKEKYLRDAADEYIKRLSLYCDLQIIEISPTKLGDNPSKKDIENALTLEGEAILKRIPDGSQVVSLCVEGKSCSSESFACDINTSVSLGKQLCFIIGSSYGLSESVKNASNLRMSLSQMTFPHQLFRVMLLEQIYRAFKINENSNYHK